MTQTDQTARQKALESMPKFDNDNTFQDMGEAMGWISLNRTVLEVALQAPVAPASEDAETLAQRFHETYERLASSFGYETRKASAKPWVDVPDQNKKLMIAVCAEILKRLTPQPTDADAQLLAEAQEISVNHPSKDARFFAQCVADYMAGNRQQPADADVSLIDTVNELREKFSDTISYDKMKELNEDADVQAFEAMMMATTEETFVDCAPPADASVQQNASDRTQAALSSTDRTPADVSEDERAFALENLQECLDYWIGQCELPQEPLHPSIDWATYGDLNTIVNHYRELTRAKSDERVVSREDAK